MRRSKRKTHKILESLVMSCLFVLACLITVPAQTQAPTHAHNTLLPIASGSQNILLAIPSPIYDEQLGLTLSESFTSLAYNVTAVNQTDSYGYGPAYLLNGLSNDGYWYQVGISYNWPYLNGGYNQGFNLNYEVFNSQGTSIYPTNGGGLQVFSGPVNPSDLISLKLNFSSGFVYMYAKDWNTSSTSYQTYADSQTTSFIALSSYANSNGFFTGLMTEWWHVNPYYGGELQVTYSDNSLAKSNAWMWMDEWEPGHNWSGAWSAGSGLLSYSSNPAKFSSLSYNGANDYSNAYDFITGPPPETAPSVSASPNNIDQGQTSTLASSAMTSGVSPYTYQWFEKSPGGSFVVVGSNSANFSFATSSSTVAGSWSFIIQVNDGTGGSVNSTAATVMVNAPPSVAVLPTSATINLGQTQSFTTTVYGGVGPFSYQWYFNGTKAAGATASSFNYVPSTAGSGTVYVIVIDIFGNQAQSNNASLTVNPSAQADLLVQGIDNTLWYRTYNTATGSDWIEIPGTTTIQPASAVFQNKLYVAAIDGSSRIWYSTIDLSTKAFSDWSCFQGSNARSVTLAASANKLVLTARGADNTLWYRAYDGTTWSDWVKIPGTTAFSPATTIFQNKLYVAAIDGSNRIWYCTIDLATKAFTDWTLFPSSAQSVTLTSSASELVLAAIGADNTLWYRTYDGTTWSNWVKIPGTTSFSPATTIVQNDLYVAAIDGSNCVWYSTIDLSSQAFTDWKQMPSSAKSIVLTALD